MKVLIDIPEKEYNRIKSKTEVNYSEMWIAEGTPLDGLTNGEVIMKMLPQLRVIKWRDSVQVMGKNYEFNHTYPLDWWNRKWGE